MYIIIKNHTRWFMHLKLVFKRVVVRDGALREDEWDKP